MLNKSTALCWNVFWYIVHYRSIDCSLLQEEVFLVAWLMIWKWVLVRFGMNLWLLMWIETQWSWNSRTDFQRVVFETATNADVYVLFVHLVVGLHVQSLVLQFFYSMTQWGIIELWNVDANAYMWAAFIDLCRLFCPKRRTSKVWMISFVVLRNSWDSVVEIMKLLAGLSARR